MEDEEAVIYTVDTREEFCDLVNRYYIRNSYIVDKKRYVDGKALYALKTKGNSFTVLSSFGVRITCLLKRKE
jgi:hypothetical protein